MGSVQDLIQLSEFQLGQQQRTPDRISSFLQSVNKTLEETTTRRRKRENQNRLSSMLLRDTGKYDAEYTVGETGAISIKYKPKTKKKKEDTFAGSVKIASQKIAEGEDWDMITGELASNYPKLYKDKTGEYLQRFTPKVGEAAKEEEEIIGVGKFDPRRVFPKFAYKGDGQKDKFGYVTGATIQKRGKTYKYLGNDKWQEQ